METAKTRMLRSRLDATSSAAIQRGCLPILVFAQRVALAFTAGGSKIVDSKYLHLILAFGGFMVSENPDTKYPSLLWRTYP
jgi:hypothetical protein